MQLSQVIGTAKSVWIESVADTRDPALGVIEIFLPGKEL